jgi:branched-chain amino acid transport system ATP-binding protein
MKSDTLLQLKNVCVKYGGIQALSGVSIKIDEGQIVALMGPNGAGKSTVLKTIFALTKIDSGDVYWNEVRIDLKPHEVAELGIAFVPQGKRVFPNLSVFENIEIGGHAIVNKKVLRERLDEVLNIFPALSTKLQQKAGLLSGGQQQMVAIARGLITDPKLLLLDEPSLGLSPKMVQEVFEKIREINARRKTAIIIVEHNIKSLLAVADWAYVLDKGVVVSEGVGADFLQNDTLEKVFMGRL